MASVREISFAISCFVLLLGGALFAGLSIGIRSEYQFQSGTKILSPMVIDRLFLE